MYNIEIHSNNFIMKEDLKLREEIIGYIKSNKPSYSHLDFNACTYTQLVILKTEIELQKNTKRKSSK